MACKDEWGKFTVELHKMFCVAPGIISSCEMFEFKEGIGKGSFGEVYRAIDRELKQEVAIKIIDLEKSDGKIDSMKIYGVSVTNFR